MLRLIFFILCFSSTSFFLQAEETDPLAPWRNARTEEVAQFDDRHVIHAYFNTSPESPDTKFILYYTSGTANGESGDLRIKDRSTGTETVIVTNITTEDAHRAACQQWNANGKTVVFHNLVDGHWGVYSYQLEKRELKLLAQDRQVAFGSPLSDWVPIYGCHWNPGEHRNLELVHSITGEIKTVVQISAVLKKYDDYIQKKFGSSDLSIFFPIMSPDDSKVFFKLSRPGGGNDFRSSKASYRDGKVVYDLQKKEFICLLEQWGHPSWTPDSKGIFEKGNFTTNLTTLKTTRFAKSCISDHPSIAPAGNIFVTDADVTKRQLRNPGDWAIAVGSMHKDDFVLIDIFNNSQGAKTWRHNHPHPAFSHDSKRIYYNTNEGPHTTLKVAHSK